MDKISIIIPCYNVEKYLAECLDSVLASEVPDGGVFELVCVDDCSTDGTLEILKAYERKYPDTILLVERAVNGGLSAARNTGMLYASGNYIGFVDSDDTIEPDMYKILYEKCSMYGCDMAECGFIEGEDTTLALVDGECLVKDEIEAFKKLCVKRPDIYAVWKRLYRRSFLDENEIRFPEGLRYEDIYFSILCYVCAGSLYVTPKLLYRYRINSEGITLSSDSKKYYTETFNVIEVTRKTLAERGLLEKYRDEIALAYFYQGFVLPLGQMAVYYGIDVDKITSIANTVVKYFPDITDNHYVKECFPEDVIESFKELVNG